MRTYNSTTKIITLMTTPLLLLALSPAWNAVAQNISDDQVITSYLEGQETKEGAAEYKPERKLVRGDLNGDGKDDLALFYTLQGYRYDSINVQFLAVFVDEGGALRYVTHKAIGGPHRRWAKLDAVSEGRILIRFRQYLSDDAEDGPIKNWRAAFAVIKGKLKEVK